MKRNQKRLVARDERTLTFGRTCLIGRASLKGHHLACTELVGDIDAPLLLIQDRSEGSEDEHPELAFRRGYQHGAVTIAEALKNAGVLSPELMAQVREFAHVTIYNWRVPDSDRERFARSGRASNPPELELKRARRAA